MSHNTNQFQNSENSESNIGKCLTPFQRKSLLKKLQTDLQPKYRRRIEIMLLADQGKSQTEICKTLGCSYHMARYWIGLAKAGLAHQWQEQPVGRPKSVNEQYLKCLKDLVSHSPREYGYPFQSWTAQWLSKHLAREMGIEITERHISRLLKQMGLSTKPRNHISKQETDDQHNCEITITDLQSPCDSHFFWTLNLMNNKH
ncbi:transposase [Nostoc sp. PCC 7524]|uniref:helix-turn-helix domain-containing protein n=1 Tax=Nostoc sp. (strain ATCC 29411 / PCC 7524) TaxID=28072 RepID=UPI00029F276C|nr:helix-turn-helix domain-containing protein [Nostoc sp. PCC 7524]AFY48149.1 transposase [Nostoc sp. PCC 7524]